MKIRSLMAALLVGGMLASPAFAANSQQDKMKACNTQAAGKKGDERKAFMKDCLSATPPKMSQQDKMKACNTQATGKKGDDRKAFMKSCLSNQPPA
ncbi:PsiF family protein [Burkholderia sp. 22PA0099]|uniref:PsiF family protein n=1 Tax=Burkholderia sp. 22PA0099 TaxID=3237372 RepID=UPI003106F6A5